MMLPRALDGVLHDRSNDSRRNLTGIGVTRCTQRLEVPRTDSVSIGNDTRLATIEFAAISFAGIRKSRFTVETEKRECRSLSLRLRSAARDLLKLIEQTRVEERISGNR